MFAITILVQGRNVTGAQLRMARAALKLGVRDLAALAQVSPNTVTRIESDAPSNSSTISAIRRALETAGVIFVAENGEGSGVRLKKVETVEAVAHRIEVLEAKAAAIPEPSEPSPEAGMNIMRKAVVEDELVDLRHKRKRLRKTKPKPPLP